jgi:hypothetical protein
MPSDKELCLSLLKEVLGSNIFIDSCDKIQIRSVFSVLGPTKR